MNRIPNLSPSIGGSAPQPSTVIRSTPRYPSNSGLPQRTTPALAGASQPRSGPPASTPVGVSASGSAFVLPAQTSRGQAQPPASLGITLEPNIMGVHLERQLPGGGCPAHSINHILQDSVIAPAHLRNATLDQTARYIEQYGGVQMRYASYPDFRGDAQLEAHLSHVGAALFELGDAGNVGGSVHQVTMVHISGRRGNVPGGYWMVFESGIPSANVDPGVLAFASPRQALDHVAQRNAHYNAGRRVLSVAYPAGLIQPQGAGRGVYLRDEGYVLTQHLTAQEAAFIQSVNLGVRVQVPLQGAEVTMPPFAPAATPHSGSEMPMVPQTIEIVRLRAASGFPSPAEATPAQAALALAQDETCAILEADIYRATTLMELRRLWKRDGQPIRGSVTADHLSEDFGSLRPDQQANLLQHMRYVAAYQLRSCSSRALHELLHVAEHLCSQHPNSVGLLSARWHLRDRLGVLSMWRCPRRRQLS